MTDLTCRSHAGPDPGAIAVSDDRAVQPAESLSWWVTDFAARLPREQARMRAERPSKAVEEYDAARLRREQDELLGRA